MDQSLAELLSPATESERLFKSEMEINFTADKQDVWNVNAYKSLDVLNYAKQWSYPKVDNK